MIDIGCYKTVESPGLVNAIELLHARPNELGFTPVDIRCLLPELGRMCGYAVTTQIKTMTTMEPFTIDTFLQLYKAVERAPKRAVIVLQEIGGYGDYAAHCGNVMAPFFARGGAVGLVTGCAARDLLEVHRMEFRFFARGTVEREKLEHAMETIRTRERAVMDFLPGSDFHLDGLRKVVVE